MSNIIIANLYNRPITYSAVNHKLSEALFGVELEIEGIVGDPEDYCGNWTMTKEDGSLRNNGWEFVTYPLHINEVKEEVAKVLKHFQLGADVHFSERTSCHVHLNVGDMSLEQLAVLLLSYQVTERLLFDFVGASRDKNIFCVPLSECVTSYQAARQLYDGQIVRVVERWRKYTALNFCRIPDIQTVEFRHMPGTPDVNKVNQWLDMIKSMRDFAMKTNYPDLVERVNTLNTSSMYMAFAFDVLGDLSWWSYAKHAPMMEEGVLTAKYSLLNRDKKESAPQPIQMNLNEWQLLREDLAVIAARHGNLNNGPRPVGVIYDDVERAAQ